MAVVSEHLVTWEGALEFVPEGLREEFRRPAPVPMVMIAEIPPHAVGIVAPGEPKPLVELTYRLEPAW